MIDPIALAPNAETEALYRSMSSEELQLFRAALTLDRDRGRGAPEFCTPRIELIAAHPG